MFKLNLEINKIASSAYMLTSFNVWHARLCHVNKRLISNMSRLNLIPKLSLHDFEKCACCSQAKIIKISHKSVARVTEPLELIHFDLCEFNDTLTRNSKRYIITFIDDCSDYTFIYLLKNKSDAYEMFKVFVTEIENQFNKRIKILRSDRGTEYDSIAFNEFYNSKGIIHETITPYSSEMSGKTERKNRTLTELVVAILLESEAASSWWSEIIKTVNYVLNRIPQSNSKTSPYEVLKHKTPNLTYLRTWGCLAYVRIPDPKRKKLASRAYECVFIGYAENSKAYRFYDLENKVIIESNDVDFFEDRFLFKSRNSGGLYSQTCWGSSSSSLPSIRIQTQDKEVDPEPRRSKRARTVKDLREDFEMYNVEDPEDLTEHYQQYMPIYGKKLSMMKWTLLNPIELGT
ncbi:hypothetical protein IC582_024522 [Cucumis melo]